MGNTEGHFPGIGAFWVKYVGANCRVEVGGVVLFTKDEINKRQEETKDPDEEAGGMDVDRLASLVHMDGMDDGQVTVEADAHQEEDAAVQVESKDGANQLAHDMAKDPTVHRLHCPEGEGEDQEEIGDGQVQDESICDGSPSSLVAAKDENHQCITQNAQEEDEGVQHRHKDAGKPFNYDGPAWFGVKQSSIKFSLIILVSLEKKQKTNITSRIGPLI
ncbi:hypothetical protein scyTo_0022101 [Scyliorhinus torazame]|uniref:Uncharacterized protein n=1 Tax=Scyliorhinus torazame TaxID=75743 RepID=A0A401Q6H1_SCYTO|nr:hypothetical protein [Scyliorhinus torazame]